MQQLFRVFVEIVFFRKGPEDLPASSFLFGMSLAFYLAASTLTSSVRVDGLSLVFEVGLDASLLVLWFGGLLYVYRCMPRFKQTMSALYGSFGLLNIVIYPVALWIQTIDKANAAIPYLIILFYIIWSVAIAANVIRRALQVPQLIGILIAFVYLMIHFVMQLMLDAEASS